jgi:pimeloyl-ACP methyl ester carboxylesterase
MPKALVDGVNLYYEVAGSGKPLVLSHEFAGSHESWREQVQAFSKHYQVITWNVRGYPPSDVPADPGAYSQDRAIADLRGLLQHLKISRAYVGGLSMGATLSLAFGLAHPEMTEALVLAGAGTGSTDQAAFAKQVEAQAAKVEQLGMAGMAGYTRGPQRIRLLQKDRAAWEEFDQLFNQHSPVGAALTLRGVQAKRRPVMSMQKELRALDIPTLVICGDEDDPCIEPSVFIKRCVRRAGLAMFPQTGHTLNLEEPDLFNQTVLRFLKAVEANAWPARDQGSGVSLFKTN